MDFNLEDWLTDKGIEGEYYSIDKLPLEIRQEFYGCVPDSSETGEYWYLKELEMTYLGEVQPWKYGINKLIVESMKHLKRFNEDITDIYDESVDDKDIKDFVKEYIKGKYTIEDDGRYYVDGDVLISRFHYSEMPIRFSTVTGSMHIINSDIFNLEGCPEKVEGDFYVDSCNYLGNLKGCPTIS